MLEGAGAKGQSDNLAFITILLGIEYAIAIDTARRTIGEHNKFPR